MAARMALAAVLPDGVEAARHLIAAGSWREAAARAVRAAEGATTAGERATALLLAESVDPALALPAAVACAAAGLSAEVLQLVWDGVMVREQVRCLLGG